MFVELVPPPGAPRAVRVVPSSPLGLVSNVRMCEQPVQLEVWATRDCYLYLIEQDCEGGICPLLPSNAAQQDAECRLQANVRRAVPDAALGDQFAIIFTPPIGLERVYAFASLRPFSTWSGDGAMLSANLRSLSRSLAVVAAQPEQAPLPGLAVCLHTFNLTL